MFLKILSKKTSLFASLSWTSSAHCVKSVQLRSVFWSLFSRIQSKYGKIRTRKNSVFRHFSHSGWWALLRLKRVCCYMFMNSSPCHCTSWIGVHIIADMAIEKDKVESSTQKVSQLFFPFITLCIWKQWKQCALPVITTMALWQLIHLHTWITK